MGGETLAQELRLIVRDEASKGLQNINSGVSALLGQLAQLAGAWVSFDGMKRVVEMGVQFNATMEDSRIGIAGVVGSIMEYRDEAGNVVVGQRAFDKSMQISDSIMADLKVRALETKATMSEMVEAFQIGIQPLGMAGIKLNDVAEATQRLTQVAGAAGIPLAQLGVELRQFAKGDEIRGRLVQVLGYTKETIKELGRSGELMADLRKRTDAFAMAAAASAQTLTGRFSNLKDAVQQVLGAATVGLYEKLKDMLGSVSAMFVSFGRTAEGALTATLNPEMIARLKEIMEAFGRLADWLKAAAPALVDFGISAAKSVGVLADALTMLPLGPTLKLITQLNEATNGWAGAIYLVSKALTGVMVLFGVKGGLVAGAIALWTSLTAAWATGIAAVTTGIAEVGVGVVSLGGSMAAAIAVSIGLWAALAVEIGLVIYSIKLFFDLQREWKAEDEANKGTESAMELQFARMRQSFDDFKGPLTAHQQQLRRQMDAIAEAAKADMLAFGFVSQETMNRYTALQRAVKNSGIIFRDSGLVAEQKKAGQAAGELTKKWDEYIAKLKDKAYLSGLDGLVKKLAEISIAHRKAIKEAKDTAQETGKDAAEALALISKATGDAIDNARKTAAANFKAEPDEIVATWDSSLRKLPDKVKLYLTASQVQSRKTVGEWRAELAAQIDALMNQFVGDESFTDGLLAGIKTIQIEVMTVTESAAALVTNVWRGMARSFDEVFYSALTGRLDNLKDAFKGLCDSLLQSFSQYLSEMLQRWLKTQITMAETGYTGKAFTTTSYGPDGKPTQITGNGTTDWMKGTLGQTVVGAGVGYGIGSFSSSKYGQIGGTIGGAAGGAAAAAGALAGLKLGSWAGPVGMIVGAIIGVIIGAILSPNSERKVDFEMKRLAAGGAVNEIGAAVLKTRDSILGQYVDMLVSAGGKATEGSKTVRDMLNDYLKSKNWQVHAGSQEDIEKDFETLVGSIIPREMMKTLFGFEKNIATPGIDVPGIKGSTNFHMGTIDEKTTAPMYKLLESLGFARDRIIEIGQQIDSRTPEEFMEWLNALVGIAVKGKALLKNLGKSWADIQSDFDKAEAKTPTEAFTEQAAAIADILGSLGNFSGDDQLKRMQDAQESADSFWQSVLDYLEQMRASQRQFSADLQAQRKQYHDFLNPESIDQQARTAWETVGSGWGKIGSAKTYDEALAAANEMRSAIDAIFSIMAERVTRGTALLKSLGGLGGAFGTMGGDVAQAAADRENPLAAMARGAADVAAQVAAASKLSGIEQIDAIEQVASAAQSMYDRQRAMLETITSNVGDLEKSIEQQKWELSLDGLDAQGTAGAMGARIKERIGSLQGDLMTATTPEQVKAITDEIQNLMSRYLGTFGADDPNRQAAKDWMSEMLDRTLGLAKEKYATMTSEIEAINKQLRDSLSAAGILIGDNVTNAANWINQLTQTLSEIDRVMREKMDSIAEGIVASADRIREELETAVALFTNATRDAGAALGGGGRGGGEGGGKDPLTPTLDFTSAVGAGADRLRDFSEALSEATGNLRGGGSTESSYVQVAAPTSRQIMSTYRRNRLSSNTKVA